jgi:hypothetical protein
VQLDGPDELLLKSDATGTGSRTSFKLHAAKIAYVYHVDLKDVVSFQA